MLFPSEGFTFTNFLADAFSIFLFVAWLWFLIIIASDLFRRDDISGVAKALWVIALLLFSYITILVYMITQRRGTAERNAQRAREFRDQLRCSRPRDTLSGPPLKLRSFTLELGFSVIGTLARH